MIGSDEQRPETFGSVINNSQNKVLKRYHFNVYALQQLLF